MRWPIGYTNPPVGSAGRNRDCAPCLIIRRQFSLRSPKRISKKFAERHNIPLHARKFETSHAAAAAFDLNDRQRSSGGGEHEAREEARYSPVSVDKRMNEDKYEVPKDKRETASKRRKHLWNQIRTIDGITCRPSAKEVIGRLTDVVTDSAMRYQVLGIFDIRAAS